MITGESTRKMLSWYPKSSNHSTHLTEGERRRGRGATAQPLHFSSQKNAGVHNLRQFCEHLEVSTEMSNT